MDENASGKSNDWADYVLKGRRTSKPRKKSTDSDFLLSDQTELDGIPTIPDNDDIDASEEHEARMSSGDSTRTNMYQEINKELKRSSNHAKIENMSILMDKFTPDEYLKKFNEKIPAWSVESLLTEFSEDYYKTHGVKN